MSDDCPLNLRELLVYAHPSNFSSDIVEMAVDRLIGGNNNFYS